MMLSYRESEQGRILHTGITEAGSSAAFQVVGTAYATHDLPMVPIYIFYSMFGFQRTGDQFWAAGDQQGAEMGTFSAKDIIAGIGYGYVLSNNWAGGANLKVVHESLGDYAAAALAVDVGLNYYNESEGLSLSMVLRNAGAHF